MYTYDYLKVNYNLVLNSDSMLVVLFPIFIFFKILQGSCKHDWYWLINVVMLVIRATTFKTP